MASELPQKSNRRSGPGWWMDCDGAWRPPAQWPGDEPPIDGWQRDARGLWGPPNESNESLVPIDMASTSDAEQQRSADHSRYGNRRPIAESPVTRARTRSQATHPTRAKSAQQPKLSRQGEADVRAMFLVGGAVGLCLLLVAAAFAMQSRADAAAGDEVVVDELPEVVFAAETEAVREERRQAFAIAAPDTARAQLANLAVAVPLADDEIRSTAEVFDETAWTTATDDCLDQAEEVLVRRSSVPIVWADNLECVPADGRWFDHYLSVEIDRTIDAEVRHLIPPAVVHASGGASWTPATRAAYMADVAHPATIAVFVSGGGHNPRDEAPDVWRPSNEATWCGYAVDWVTVKTRWQLSVTDAERNALEEMLDSCNQPESTGAHVGSMLIEAIDEPTIERLDNG